MAKMSAGGTAEVLDNPRKTEDLLPGSITMHVLPEGPAEVLVSTRRLGE